MGCTVICTWTQVTDMRSPWSHLCREPDSWAESSGPLGTQGWAVMQTDSPRGQDARPRDSHPVPCPTQTPSLGALRPQQEWVLEESANVRYVTERGRGGNRGRLPRRTTTTGRQQDGGLSRVPSRRTETGGTAPAWDGQARPLLDLVSGPPPRRCRPGPARSIPSPSRPQTGSAETIPQKDLGRLPPMRAGDALRGRGAPEVIRRCGGRGPEVTCPRGG